MSTYNSAIGLTSRQDLELSLQNRRNNIQLSEYIGKQSKQSADFITKATKAGFEIAKYWKAQRVKEQEGDLLDAYYSEQYDLDGPEQIKKTLNDGTEFSTNLNNQGIELRKEGGDPNLAELIAKADPSAAATLAKQVIANKGGNYSAWIEGQFGRDTTQIQIPGGPPVAINEINGLSANQYEYKKVALQHLRKKWFSEQGFKTPSGDLYGPDFLRAVGLIGPEGIINKADAELAQKWNTQQLINDGSIRRDLAKQNLAATLTTFENILNPTKQDIETLQKSVLNYVAVTANTHDLKGKEILREDAWDRLKDSLIAMADSDILNHKSLKVLQDTLDPVTRKPLKVSRPELFGDKGLLWRELVEANENTLEAIKDERKANTVEVVENSKKIFLERSKDLDDISINTLADEIEKAISQSTEINKTEALEAFNKFRLETVKTDQHENEVKVAEQKIEDNEFVTDDVVGSKLAAEWWYQKRVNQEKKLKEFQPFKDALKNLENDYKKELGYEKPKTDILESHEKQAFEREILNPFKSQVLKQFLENNDSISRNEILTLQSQARATIEPLTEKGQPLEYSGGEYPNQPPLGVTSTPAGNRTKIANERENRYARALKGQSVEMALASDNAQETFGLEELDYNESIKSGVIPGDILSLTAYINKISKTPMSPFEVMQYVQNQEVNGEVDEKLRPPIDGYANAFLPGHLKKALYGNTVSRAQANEIQKTIAKNVGVKETIRTLLPWGEKIVSAGGESLYTLALGNALSEELGTDIWPDLTEEGWNLFAEQASTITPEQILSSPYLIEEFTKWDPTLFRGFSSIDVPSDPYSQEFIELREKLNELINPPKLKKTPVTNTI